MKQPFQSEAELLADIDRVKRRAGTLDLWWLGQSGYLVQHRESWVLIDPYLSDTLTVKYAGTNKPHVRMTQRVVDPETLAKSLQYIYLVASSHAHTDHLDPGTLKPLFSKSKWICRFICPKPQMQLSFERSGANDCAVPPKFQGLDAGESHGEAGLKVTAIPAAHETIERDENGHCKHLGYVFEFSDWCASKSGSIQRRVKEWTVYHSGDTLLYDGLVDHLRPFNIDVAILPINGKVGNMNGRDAAQLAKAINAKLVIPCHYDMFEFNTADPKDQFIPECEKLGQPYRVLQQGERWSSTELT